MRSLLTICIALASTVYLTSNAPAQEVRPDTYWQRDSGAVYHDDIRPFRKPIGLVGDLLGQCRDLLIDLQEMRRLASEAKPDELVLDEKGREICTLSTWERAYGNVKANSLSMAGNLSEVLRKSDSALQRSVCVYGIFYFNNPQDVIKLITVLPGEPLQKTREDGFKRALNYLKVHFPLNRPQNPRFPDNGIVVPKYDFNPLPFFLLLEQPMGIDQAQGLWFLTEVLKIRPDMGRIYLEETLPEVRKLIVSEDKLVREHAARFLAAIERRRERVPMDPVGADDEILTKWLQDLEHDLFPPIRHVSSGIVDLYPSDELDRLVAAGKRILNDSLLPKGSASTPKSVLKVRYGVRIASLPTPLDQLGLPENAVVVQINGQDTRSAADVRRLIEEQLAGIEQRLEQRAARDAVARSSAPAGDPAGDPARGPAGHPLKDSDPQKKENLQRDREKTRQRLRPIASFLVEYVQDQRSLLKEFRLLQ
jgi:hypothetical protein